MDKNNIIGIVIIFLMLIGYTYLAPNPEPQVSTETSGQVVEPKEKTLADAGTADSVTVQSGDTTRRVPVAFSDVKVKTKDLEVVFSDKGGVIREVRLNQYKTYDQKPLYLVAEGHNRFQLEYPTASGTINLENAYFAADQKGEIQLGEADSLQLKFRHQLPNNEWVEQSYVVRGSGYLIGYSLKSSSGAGQYDKSLRFVWTNDMLQLENDMKENRKVVTVNYYTDALDDLGISPDGALEESTANPVKWFTIKHKYFLSGLIADNTPFQSFRAGSSVNPASLDVVKTVNVETAIPVADIQKGNANFQYYFGPNDYHVVGKVNAENFEQNVYLGYAFLKPINKYFLVPLFNFLERFFSNYGLLIICLVLIVKTILMPLTYKSYVSMAKMKVMAPEIEEIRSKYPDDMAKQQQEQMKLYQQVGVSPLSGCIPVLATMPILFSLFFLFPNLIELRQKAFLWATDLSTYDAFVKFPFTIPFYGDHLSLFTVLMTVSSIGYAYYSNQMTPAQPGPINMKYLSYVMPVMFMFFLNSFPAGLTFYYFVSNLVTIVQQLIIRRMVDDDKIRAILDGNRQKFKDKPQKQSKFRNYIEKSLQAAEEAKKKQEEAQRKAGGKKK
ncbi:membrane protein insertase YidC [Ravibacter arvi]|uniref:Membrane protein insertase YidC n=1 Tax=Ravibacter arvi TaxID=2051041 RepID=A0ABP8M6B7_9BACT